MSKLSRDVELEIQRRMDDLDAKAQQANQAMSQLGPKIDQVGRGLSGLQDLISRSMDATIERSCICPAQARRVRSGTCIQRGDSGE